MIKRFAIVVHRWLGVTLCLVFLLWFPSGIGMMYWDFPSVTAADRLDRSPSLDASTIRVSPAEAYLALGETPSATDARLSTFDGRPAYRFGGGGGDRVVYADTGARQVDVTQELMLRVASAWTRLPASAALKSHSEQCESSARYSSTCRASVSVQLIRCQAAGDRAKQGNYYATCPTAFRPDSVKFR